MMSYKGISWLEVGQTVVIFAGKNEHWIFSGVE